MIAVQGGDTKQGYSSLPELKIELCLHVLTKAVLSFMTFCLELGALGDG